MISRDDVLFMLGETLIEISREVFADGDSQENHMERVVNEILESHESKPGSLAMASKHMIAKIKEIKERSNTLASSASKKKSLKDAIARELGVSLDASGMNHMNLPVGTWIEQDINIIANPALLSKQNMHTPLMTQLLDEWSNDTNKHLYVLNWAECLSAKNIQQPGILPPLPDAFPQGLQIVGLSSVLKEGFLLLLVPVVRSLSVYPLRVFLRRRLLDESSHQSVLAGPQNFDFVYDLRIKVIPPELPILDESEHSGLLSNANTKPITAAPSDSSSGSWFSGLVNQVTPLASLLDWANSPAQDNSYVEKMEAQVGRARSKSGSNIVVNPVMQRNDADRARDRAWSQVGLDDCRPRIASAENMGVPVRAVDTQLEHYGIDLPEQLSPSDLISLSINADNIGVPDSYVAPTFPNVDTFQKPPAGAAVADANSTAADKLSLVEAKLAKLRSSAESAKKK